MMSKTTDNLTADKPKNMGTSTFYNQKRNSPAVNRPAKTPPKLYDSKKSSSTKGGVGVASNLPELKKKQQENSSAIYSAAFHEVALQEKDERFRYLLKHGELKKVEKNGNIIFAQLPQIQNIWVCYRRPIERETSLDKLNLDDMELTHLPLLEGEEKLKMLTFQHNKIAKLENLISLPNLLYLDLYDNGIKEIENLSVLNNLKVLLLPKNQISRIKNISDLAKLEVLDLHSNRISKIEGFWMLNSIRILNLANNQITKLENLEYLSNLTELNLKLNSIITIENLKHLQKLEKLYLANNKIQIRQFDSVELVKLVSLKELTLQNNPCSKNKADYLKNVVKYMPFLKMLDGKTPALETADAPSRETIETDEDHSEVLKLIESQWAEEKRRIVALERSNASKRELLKTTCITGGHAQIEDESILFIFGNSYDVVLNNQTFQDSVEKIRFEYVFFEFLIEPTILNMLRKFKKLKVLEFKYNYITSLLQIAKLENLTHLRSMLVEPHDNPVASCSFLKEFIVYRLPAIVQVNKEDVKQTDRTKAKVLFHNFDRALQIPEKLNNPQNLRVFPSEDPEAKRDRVYLKTVNKILAEAAESIVAEVADRAVVDMTFKAQTEAVFERTMLSLINKETKSIS